MPIQRVDVIEAAASYSTVGAVLTTIKARGGVLARTGVGVATLTLDRPLAAEDGIILAGARTGAGNTNVQVTHTSDSVKTISGFVAAVATEIAVDVLVVRFAAGSAN